jgi:hypothetical protein
MDDGESVMSERERHIWEVWYPGAGATGLPFGRGRLDPTDVLWLHAAPAEVSVAVRDEAGRLVATGTDLKRGGPRLPMTRLWREGERIQREDRWPTQADLGGLVLLAGGEVGRLVAWWHAADHAEWRWRLEFYNHV